jgi:4-amino-4-deoxy-L-arabinose transferase-like glycosyltransferase
MPRTSTVQLHQPSTSALPSTVHNSTANFKIGALNAWLQSPIGFLATAVLLALAIRLIIVAIVFRDVSAPTIDHSEFGFEMGWTARSLALGRGFSSPFLPITGPTADIPPLYPFLLSIVFRLFGLYTAASAIAILSLNSLFSALTCIPLYFSLRHAASNRLARFAAIGWAIYPFAIYFSADRVWDYALTALLFTTCFCIVQRLHLRTRRTAWLAFGLLYGFTVLSNPSVLSLFPFLLLLAMWRVRSTGGPWLRNGLLAILGVFSVMTPWTVRNYRTLHVLCPVRDDFWDEFWSANNGDSSNPTLAWAHPASNPEEMQLYKASGEVHYFAQKHVLAVEFVKHRPLFFAGLTLRRIASYWTGFWSLSPAYVKSEPFQFPNFFFCTTLTLFMLRGLRRWWRTDPASALPYLILIAVFPLAYYVSHPLMDYRQPIEPAILALVVIGLFGVRAKSSSSILDDQTYLTAFPSEVEVEEPVVVAAMDLAPISLRLSE